MINLNPSSTIQFGRINATAYKQDKSQATVKRIDISLLRIHLSSKEP
jgi:hypothetical protein